MAFRGQPVIGAPAFATPTGAVDIGDAAVQGVGPAAASSQHQHAVPAPAAGYATYIAGAPADGAETTPARAGHTHGHRAVDHQPGGFADLSAVFARRGATGDGVQYVSVGGNDAQDGLSIGSPKATVAAAIAAVPASGGLVIIGPGVYAMAAAAQIAKSNVTLAALFPRSATLRATAASANPWLGLVQVRDPASIATISNVELNGLILDGNNQGNMAAFTAQGFSNLRLINCQFTGGSATAIATTLIIGGNTNSVTGPTSERLVMRDCEIGPSHNHGMMFAGGLGSATPTLVDVVIDRCYVHDNDDDGVSLFMNAQRVIRDVHFLRSRFRNNCLANPGGGFGHINDNSRCGWVDTEVAGCYFDVAGSASNGGFSDHRGRNIWIHHNTFRLASSAIWPIALGDANTLTNVDRTWFCWVEDNYFEGCAPWDWDSSNDIFVRRNVFYRGYGRPLGTFGDHLRNYVEDNWFIENGQAPVNVNEYDKAGLTGGPGFVVRRNYFRDDQATKTQLYGIYESAGANLTDDAVYEDNHFGNTTTPIHKDAAFDAIRYVRRNKGLNPVGPNVVSIGASPVNYVAGDTPEVLMIRASGGGLNATKANGAQIVSLGAGVAGPDILLEPHETVTIVYAGGAPTLYRDVR